MEWNEQVAGPTAQWLGFGEPVELATLPDLVLEDEFLSPSPGSLGTPGNRKGVSSPDTLRG